MSFSVAVWPFLVTCVLSLTGRASVSSFFDLSSFWTLPVTWFEALLLLMPVDGLSADDPVVEPVAEPLVPIDEPLLEGAPIVLEPDFDVSLLPLEPVLLPLDPVCASAGAATSSPAIPRPATIPHPSFIRFTPDVETEPGTCRGSSCWLPIR